MDDKERDRRVKDSLHNLFTYGFYDYPLGVCSDQAGNEYISRDDTNETLVMAIIEEKLVIIRDSKYNQIFADFAKANDREIKVVKAPLSLPARRLTWSNPSWPVVAWDDNEVFFPEPDDHYTMVGVDSAAPARVVTRNSAVHDTEFGVLEGIVD